MTHYVNANPTKKVAKRQSRFRLALSSMYKKYIDSATNFYLDRGVDPITIAGIFGNISKESGWNPLANALDNGLGDYYGLAQMSPDMRKEVKRVYGKIDADATHRFIYDSMRGDKKISKAWRSYMKDYGGYWNNLYDTPEAAALAFGRVFERPNEAKADWGERQLSAKDAYDYIMLVLNMRNNNIGNPIKTTITGDGRKVMTVNPNFYVESGMLDSALKPQIELPVQQAAPILPRQAQPKDIAPAPWDLNQLILNRGIEVSPRKSPFSLSLSLPKLEDLFALNTPLRLMQEDVASILGLSDIQPEMPSLFPRFKCGKLPRYLSGTTPITEKKNTLSIEEARLAIDNMYPKAEPGLSGEDPLLKWVIPLRMIGKGINIIKDIISRRIRKDAQLEYREARLNGHSRNVSRIIATPDDLPLNLLNWESKIFDWGFKNGKLPKYADGKSPIHIKHPGRLTRLKARTGKSESELYNDGNPAHKKMVVFARNARKWKH